MTDNQPAAIAKIQGIIKAAGNCEEISCGTAQLPVIERAIDTYDTAGTQIGTPDTKLIPNGFLPTAQSFRSGAQQSGPVAAAICIDPRPRAPDTDPAPPIPLGMNLRMIAVYANAVRNDFAGVERFPSIWFSNTNDSVEILR